eukprot:4784656-Lingulodinium_polyedra.AAC.1
MILLSQNVASKRGMSSTEEGIPVLSKANIDRSTQSMAREAGESWMEERFVVHSERQGKSKPGSVRSTQA